MRILSLLGSPRIEKGVTNLVLQNFLAGAKSAGAEVDFVPLIKKKINPCLGCWTCWEKTPGKCVQKDDMAELLELLKSADLIIPATPLYTDTMTSIMKVFWDRSIPAVSPLFEKGDNRTRHIARDNKERRLFLITVCGLPEMSNFEPLIFTFQRICYNAHMKYIGEIRRPASHYLLLGKLLGKRVEEILKAIETAGSEVVRNGQVSVETKQKAEELLVSPEDFITQANRWWKMKLAANKVLDFFNISG